MFVSTGAMVAGTYKISSSGSTYRSPFHHEQKMPTISRSR
jgi:hypothetical protein